MISIYIASPAKAGAQCPGGLLSSASACKRPRWSWAPAFAGEGIKNNGTATR